MKFLSALQAKYESLGLEQPQWLKEYTAPSIATPAAPTVTPTAAPVVQPAASASTGQGVINALNKAIDLFTDDPEIQKLKTDMTKKIQDAKKQITDTSAKTMDTMNKAIANLQTVATNSQATPVQR